MPLPAPATVRGSQQRLRSDLALRRFARTRDPQLRAAVIESYLPLARSVARRFGAVYSGIDDLEQVAAMGLVKAVDRFDPGKGRAFTSYAVPTITGELQRHLRDHDWAIRPPRRLYELAAQAERTATVSTQRRGRPPTLEELASEAGCAVEDLAEALEGTRDRRLTSLDAPAYAESGDATIGEVAVAHDGGIQRADRVLALREALRRLPLRTRRVLFLRFYGDLTQVEIARQLGISQMQVSRVLREALAAPL